MIEQALARCRLSPYKHQLEGIHALVTKPAFALFDEMGAGKTLQVIVSAQILALQGVINRVVVICPASVRAVWFDPELGELAKHLFVNFPATITEFHVKTRYWEWFVNVKGQKFSPLLHFTITNYDFIRKDTHLKNIIGICNQKTLLVLDESSAIKSWKTHQTTACEKIRAKCGRIVILNGTPVANNPGDLYSQAHILNPLILGCKTFFHFRARYAQMGGWQMKQIVGWHDIDDLQKRLGPYVLRRLKEQCLDLPEKIPSVPIFVPMEKQTWKIYKQMKDDMVAWLSNSELSSASQAIVKGIRLAQITSGFVGGVETQEADEIGIKPDFVEDELFDETSTILPQGFFEKPLQEISREKLTVFLDWFTDRLSEDPNIKILVWCRFRPEVERLFKTLSEIPGLKLGRIWGGQKRPDREEAIRLLDPRTAPAGPVVVIGTPASGSMGLNLTAAHTVVYMSNDFSLKTRLQSEDRVHRPGQTHPVSYFDIVATGPDGQKTIDHSIVKALQAKENMADFTTAAWIAALEEE